MDPRSAFPAELARWRADFERAVALDPDNIFFRADNLYYMAGSAGAGTKNGGMSRADAFGDSKIWFASGQTMPDSTS